MKKHLRRFSKGLLIFISILLLVLGLSHIANSYPFASLIAIGIGFSLLVIYYMGKLWEEE